MNLRMFFARCLSFEFVALRSTIFAWLIVLSVFVFCFLLYFFLQLIVA